MKILVYKWDMYPYDDIIQTLKKQGHQVDVLAFPISNHIEDAAFEEALCKKLTKNTYDFVFSINYYTVISVICTRHKITYVSWTCDSPLLSLQHPSVSSPYNHIFLFDYKEYTDLQKRGVRQSYYLPLAGLLLNDTFDATKPVNYHYDISFVGNLYDRNRYDEMCYYLPEYLRGYMDCAIEAQKQISGGTILPQMLNDDILTVLSHYTTVANGTSSLEELRMHFATSVLSYKAAADMRADALNLLATGYDTHLFTTSLGENLENVFIHPPVSYHTDMPEVFHHSKINLNITLPNIENGIPLRVFDVLASGGFLLTDYREALCREFENGTDLVIFDGMADLKQKADYYLAHDSERRAIAKNGQKKVQKLHQYDIRLKKILHIVFQQE